jgi:protein tyrosine phosphatase (PTP) superfamily phosphohydrolase (DUF442 family)
MAITPTVILVGLMLIAGCAAGQPAAGVRRPAATVAPVEPLPGGLAGVDNFGFVTPDLWRGGQPTAEGWASLRALGVRTVISLRSDDGDLADLPAGVAYVHVPSSSWYADRLDTDAVCRAIDAAAKPVFVHCRQGRDRTGLAIAAYRVRAGVPADAAVADWSTSTSTPGGAAPWPTASANSPTPPTNHPTLDFVY